MVKEKVKIKEEEQAVVNIGIIGHVDHGKTSLTKALTGKWTDTHSEELKRGISIRMGYADTTFYKIKTSNGIKYSNKKEGKILEQRTVSFVDAPGHETLMTTMLSGAALMNGAILVIAANEECPQPRTIEHLMALKFAGVKNIVIAQNKIDLVSREKVIKNFEKIKKFLKDYGFEKAPIIPISANFGANIDLLIEAIETTITTPKYDLKKPLKMFIARSFDINKPGTEIKKINGAILGGSISQGIIKIEDELELCPGLNGKTKIKVMTISTSKGIVKEAHAGGLIAIGTNLDPSISQNDQLRGKIIGKIGSIPDPVKKIRMKINLFERMINLDKKNTEIKINDPLVLTIGTNTGVGFVTTTKKEEIEITLKNEEIIEKNQKIAISKNINNQWRLIAYGEVI
ncbi:MAG: translation initiation factor IF-2 subunit gamma [Candidatus ainarchaeum sp.]|nr:translation initiation factor IF-2 subunit gamma [Candidatus ainarchaeum sp.]